MMLQRLAIRLFCISIIGYSHSNAQLRYADEIFSSYELRSDIQYGSVTTANNAPQQLLLDLYTGTGDTETLRPLVIYIHGGGFKNGDKVQKQNTLMCSTLAKCGYAAASINYRLSRDIQSNEDYFAAMVKAVQDAKAAVRFFRKNGKAYAIDTSVIFVMGSSAGAITALHMAYLNETEIPAYVDMKKTGPLEGTSGNPGYSSKVSGVINCWGALTDYRMMNAGDPPVFSIHGVKDTTIAYDSSFGYHPFKHGSTIIHSAAQSLGIPSGLRLFYNTGHTLDNNRVKQDSAAHDITRWLSSILKK